jgi:hypothetical protein
MTVIPFPGRKRWLRELSSAAPPADVMADLVFSMILSREAELVDEAEAGFVVHNELDVVQALLRLILSPNVRMPLSRLH